MSPSALPDDGLVAGVPWHAEAIDDRPERLRPFRAVVERAGAG